MRLIRWFFTFVLVFVASLLALMLLAFLLIAFGLLQFARLAQWVRPPAAGSAAPARPASAAVEGDVDLPEAPPDVPLNHLRSWDPKRNRAVDRWYYKDAQGQWVFVRRPRHA
ncbi:MAG: hypothetical protein BGP06_11365 [Rhizobiales bacterium 65-9]|nr:hypothetical protein [Hyphomicrobiales bacterium]OJY32914.1 MAG: hypothetical protein BGP06_11365 [Rhizobiales bacterium 65-9]